MPSYPKTFTVLQFFSLSKQLICRIRTQLFHSLQRNYKNKKLKEYIEVLLSCIIDMNKQCFLMWMLETNYLINIG